MNMNVQFTDATQAFGVDMGQVQRVTVGNVELDVVETAQGVLITAKDADGTETALVRHGRTPVAGTDYFTASDKVEMVSAVLAALPVYTGEVETV